MIFIFILPHHFRRKHCQNFKILAIHVHYTAHQWFYAHQVPTATCLSIQENSQVYDIKRFNTWSVFTITRRNDTASRYETQTHGLLFWTPYHSTLKQIQVLHITRHSTNQFIDSISPSPKHLSAVIFSPSATRH